jgi:membrane protein DedA with SNARE-associated domain
MMSDWIEHFSYLGVLLALLAGGVGAPIPEDVPLLVGGYLCASGAARLGLMLPLALVGALASDCMIYWIGRRYGMSVQRLPLIRWAVSRQNITQARTAFRAHSGKSLMAARFIPGVRFATFFTAGAFRVPFWKLLVFDGLAACFSVPLVVMVGYIFADAVDLAAMWVRRGQVGALTAIVLVVLAFVAGRWLARRRMRATATVEAGDRPQTDAQRRVG